MSLFLLVNVPKVALVGLWISLGIVALILLYKLLLRRLKRDIPDFSSFVDLHPLEMHPAKGEVEFYFTMEHDQAVTFTVKSADDSFSKVLLDKELKNGPHIVRFDSLQVPNGKYSFEVKTHQQHTMKFFAVQN